MSKKVRRAIGEVSTQWVTVVGGEPWWIGSPETLPSGCQRVFRWQVDSGWIRGGTPS